MKKILLFLSLAVVLSSVETFASGVGYVDYNYIYKNWSVSKQYTKQIEAKATAIKKYNEDTKKAVAAKQTTEEKQAYVNSRKAGYEKLRGEYTNLKNKQQTELMTKVKTASDVVLKQKELDIIVDRRVWVAGGVDCTTDILKAIK